MRVAVIGGGIAGLAAAMALQEGGSEVRLFEAGSRLGGAIHTTKSDGYVFEEGAISVDAPAPAFRRLAAMAGITDRLIESDPAHSARLLYYHGHLIPLPTDLWSFLKTPVLTVGQKLRALLEPVIPKMRVTKDMSVAEFFGRRMGRAISSTWVDVIAGHIFAGHPNRLGMRGAFPNFYAAVERQGGVLRAFVRDHSSAEETGGRLVLSFAEGLSALPAACVLRLGESIHPRTRVLSLTRRAAGGFALGLQADEKLEDFHCDQVVIATPARTAATLATVLSPTVSDLLCEIESASVVTAVLAAKRREVPGLPRGRDFHAARWTRMRTLGWTFTSNLFPGHAGEDRVVMNGMVGGLLDASAIRQKSEVLEHSLLAELALALGQRKMPRADALKIVRWPLAIPQYNVGHLRRMEAVRTLGAAEMPGLRFAGNYLSGVSIEGAIREGLRAAEELLQARALP